MVKKSTEANPSFTETIQEVIIQNMKDGGRPNPITHKPKVIGRHFQTESIKKVVKEVISNDLYDQYEYETEGKDQEQVLKISMDYVTFTDWEYQPHKSYYAVGMEEWYDYQKEETVRQLTVKVSGPKAANRAYSFHDREEQTLVSMRLTQDQFWSLLKGNNIQVRPTMVDSSLYHNVVRLDKDEKTGEVEVISSSKYLEYEYRKTNRNPSEVIKSGSTRNSKSSSKKTGFKPAKI